MKDRHRARDEWRRQFDPTERAEAVRRTERRPSSRFCEHCGGLLPLNGAYDSCFQCAR